MTKNQIILITFFFHSVAFYGQQAPDTLPVFIENKLEAEMVYTEHDMIQDSINSSLVPISNEVFTTAELQNDYREEYSGTEFQYEIREENSFLTRLRDWWKRITDFFKRSNKGTGGVVFDEIFNIILVFLLLIGLGFLIYYLNKKGFIRLFSKKEEFIFNEKYIEENIDKIDFESLTHQAKQDNDFRKAIRYYYLWLLKNWSHNEIIRYEPEKTTKIYLQELQHAANKTAFQYVSYVYDNVWYGAHEVSKNDFTQIENQFLNLIKKTDEK